MERVPNWTSHPTTTTMMTALIHSRHFDVGNCKVQIFLNFPVDLQYDGFVLVLCICVQIKQTLVITMTGDISSTMCWCVSVYVCVCVLSCASIGFSINLDRVNILNLTTRRTPASTLCRDVVIRLVGTGLSRFHLPIGLPIKPFPFGTIL